MTTRLGESDRATVSSHPLDWVAELFPCDGAGSSLHRVLILCLVTGLAVGAHAQPPSPPQTAPALPTPKLSSQIRVFVREFRFEGNHAFTDAGLAKVVAPFTGREITSEELEDARRAITLHYVNHGFINSGAILPDQNVKEGVITFQIIEGVLTEIRVESNRWLRTSYIEGRIHRYAEPPLNLVKLQQGLQILRQNPNLQQINAELKPGVKPGESMLDVRVKEEQPFRFSTEVANDRPPSVGSYEWRAMATHMNLTGHSDVLAARYGIAHWRNGDDFDWSEFDNISGSYTLPINSYDTSIEIHGSKYDTVVTEEAFKSLDITSETIRYGGGIRHPLYRTANREFAVGMSFDREESDNFILNQPGGTSLSLPATLNLSVLRLTQEFLDRGLNHVFALRSTVSQGVDAFGVTRVDHTKGVPEPDPEFTSWLGQAQFVQRLFNTPNQLILRANFQWTEDTLYSPEEFSVGGMYSVRGYRENELVRDRGFFASAEFRLPVWTDKSGRDLVQLAPFLDWGGAWYTQGKNPSPSTLGAAGAGILLNPNKHVNAVMYWGYPFEGWNHITDPQDISIHFRVTFNAF